MSEGTRNMAWSEAVARILFHRNMTLVAMNQTAEQATTGAGKRFWDSVFGRWLPAWYNGQYK
jgi:hypothetical protein